jgi:phosphoribosylamine--glycine ligase
MNEVMIPMVKGMAAEGCPYKGVLYAGLMIDRDTIKVLEFNGRFGDPEAQPLLVRMQNDIIPIIEAIIDERLDTCRLEIDPRASVCVVMAAGGYPGKYKKGLEITGIDAANRMRDVMVFHAGTRSEGKKILSHGGRVLGVTALGNTVELGYQEGLPGGGENQVDGGSLSEPTSAKRPWCGCRRCHGSASSWAAIRT